MAELRSVMISTCSYLQWGNIPLQGLDRHMCTKNGSNIRVLLLIQSPLLVLFYQLAMNLHSQQNTLN